MEQNENVQLTATITAGIGAFMPNGNTANVIIQDNDGTKFAIIIAEVDIDNIIIVPTVLIIGFEPTIYQVTEAMGVVQVCFEVEQNNVLDVLGMAILNTASGSALGMTVQSTLLSNIILFFYLLSFS